MIGEDFKRQLTAKEDYLIVSVMIYGIRRVFSFTEKGVLLQYQDEYEEPCYLLKQMFNGHDVEKDGKCISAWCHEKWFDENVIDFCTIKGNVVAVLLETKMEIVDIYE